MAATAPPPALASPCTRYTEADAQAVLQPLDARVVDTAYKTKRENAYYKYAVKIAGTTDQVASANLQLAQAKAMLRIDEAALAAKRKAHRIERSSTPPVGGWPSCRFRYDRVALDLSGSLRPVAAPGLRSIAEQAASRTSSGVAAGGVSGRTSFTVGRAQVLWSGQGNQGLAAMVLVNGEPARFSVATQLAAVAQLAG